IRPSPSTSCDVSTFPLLLRSTHSDGSLAIFVIDACPAGARLATHTSPLKSTEVRDGELPAVCTAWCGGCAWLPRRACQRASSSPAQQPFVPSHDCVDPVGSDEQVTVK